MAEPWYSVLKMERHRNGIGFGPGKAGALLLRTVISLTLFLVMWPGFGNCGDLKTGWNRLKACCSVPEYNRSMKKVVISISCHETTLDIQHSLLSCLPDYTEIYLLLPKTCLEPVKTWLEDKPYRNQIKYLAYDVRRMTDAQFHLLFREKEALHPCDVNDYYFYDQFGTLWAQDLFEVMQDPNGEKILLSSCIHRYFSSDEKKHPFTVTPDNRYLSSFSAFGMDVFRLPLAFKGGNILVDQIGEKRVAFCGGDVYRNTRTFWKSFAVEIPSVSTVNNILKDALNLDEVHIVGSSLPQPCLMYHLDQAMIILPNRHVGVARIVYGPDDNQSNNEKIEDVKIFLSELRTLLKKMGYRILDIAVSKDNLIHCQHYINAVPFIDEKTRQRTLLMPIFPLTQSKSDIEIMKRNKKVYESLGYKVIYVPTESYEFKGGIHCLVNVLE